MGIEIITQAKLHTVFPTILPLPIQRVLHKCFLILGILLPRGCMRKFLDNCTCGCFFNCQNTGGVRKTEAGVVVEYSKDQRTQWTLVGVFDNAPHTAFSFFWRTPMLYRCGEISPLIEEPCLLKLLMQGLQQRSSIDAVCNFPSSLKNVKQLLLVFF